MSDMSLAASWARGAADLRRDAQKMLEQAGEADVAMVEAAGWQQGCTSRAWSHPDLPSSAEGVKFQVALDLTMNALRIFGKFGGGK